MLVNPRDLIPHPQNQAIYGHESIQDLVDSIGHSGYIEPLIVTPDMVVISGHRRLKAAIDLGLLEVPVRVEHYPTDTAALEALLLANQYREKTPDQRAREGMQWEKIIAEKSKLRQIATQNNHAGKAVRDAASLTEVGRTSDQVARMMGFGSRKTYERTKKATLVIDESPPDVADALRTILGKSAETAAYVSAQESPQVIIKTSEELLANPELSAQKAFEKVKKEERRESARESIVQEAILPQTKYRVIYADPPWKYGNTMPDYFHEQADHYPLMTVADIVAMPIRNLCLPNAVLFLWVTSPILAESFEVIQAWGFTYKSAFIWDKIKHNMGHYNSVRHELLLIAVRGSCQPDIPTLFDSVQSIERTEHSRKPDEFRTIIDTLYPHGKRLELFARQTVAGWDSYGNQIPR